MQAQVASGSDAWGHHKVLCIQITFSSEWLAVFLDRSALGLPRVLRS